MCPILPISRLISVKPLNGIVLTEELREELDQAAVATQQAYATARGGGAPGSSVPGGVGGPNDEHGGAAGGLVLTPNSIAANLEDLLAEKGAYSFALCSFCQRRQHAGL